MRQCIAAPAKIQIFEYKSLALLRITVPALVLSFPGHSLLVKLGIFPPIPVSFVCIRGDPWAAFPQTDRLQSAIITG